MTLFTKCIFKKPEPSDGIRISVMSRHTLDDGKTPDKRITLDSFDIHDIIFAPPLKLVGSYKRGEKEWEIFEHNYTEYLRSELIHPYVKILSELATRKDITLLCSEEDPKECHRRILAEECQKYQPSLKVIHK